MSHLVLLLVPQTNLQKLLQPLALMSEEFVQLPPPVLEHLQEIVNLQEAALGSLNQLCICIWTLAFEFFYELS